ncbi:MAG: helix-turn-helix transcriptional regulator [Actinomycetes bacterium]
MPLNPETLKQLRELRGWTQQELAEEIGVHRVTIANLERGTAQPSLEVVEALAKSLRVKVTDLLK